jgi:hypothetical protein
LDARAAASAAGCRALVARFCDGHASRASRVG